MSAPALDLPRRMGFGVGLDLPWGAAFGFGNDPGRPDVVSERVTRFLQKHAATFRALFVSWQPQNRDRPDARDYDAPFRDLFARAPVYEARGLHHTALNLGALEAYDHDRVADFTNALVEAHALRWVNEDLGLWSIHGRPLPYPLPPYLTPAGLRAAVRNVARVLSRLTVPLEVEFPGFSEGASFCVGTMHAYDFFRAVVEETGAHCTLDVGHLLSYQWFRGMRGEALYGELERLPLARCTELHLSGCSVTGGRFMDLHHGVLLDEQLVLIERLLPLCPDLRLVTYEDPRFDDEGELIPKARANFERLAAITARWSS